jgi:putative inner membrane exporter YdcZ
MRAAARAPDLERLRHRRPPARLDAHGRRLRRDHHPRDHGRRAARLGTTGTIALLITGNLVAAVAIDRFGWLGSDRITLHWYRVLGVFLLAAGAALALKK